MKLKDVLRYEFIGLNCEVVDAKNKSLIGIKGIIVDETMNTIVIKNSNGKKCRILKKGVMFKIKFKDKNVLIPGDDIMLRPEDRIKMKYKKW